MEFFKRFFPMFEDGNVVDLARFSFTVFVEVVNVWGNLLVGGESGMV